MTAPDIIAAVRAAGADIAIDSTGPRIRGASLIPAEMVVLCRAHRDEIVAELTRPAQLALDLIAAPPLSFLERQEAKFDRLCAGFGIPVEPPACKAKPRSAA